METFRDLRALARWIDRGDRVRWLLLVPVVSVAAIVEAVGALAIFGLLRLVMDPAHLRTMPIVSDIWQRWRGEPYELLGALVIAVALFYVGRGVFLAWTEWLKESIIHRSGARAAERLFQRYLAADYAFHLRRRSTSLIEEVARSTDAAYQLVAASAVNILAELTTLAALMAVLLTSAPPRALLALVFVIGIVAIPVMATRRVWVRWGELHKRFSEQELHVLQQSLGAVKAVKIAGRESFFESRLRSARRLLFDVRRERAWGSSALRLGVETVLIVSMLIILLIVILRGESAAQTISVLALFAYTGFRAVPSANRIMLNLGYLREGRPFVRAVAADFDALGMSSPRPQGPERTVDFREKLAFEQVGFVYEDDSRAALEDINLVIRRGESVGIVGPTGSGKSTLVDVLLGLLQPTSGRVLLDGHDLRGYERAWQRLIGYVPQDPYLLDDTVRRNIAFGVPDTAIDEQRLARACTLAQLDDFVRQLPAGLDTTIGEDGVRLSGGQRQRVAIARALYQDPEVLVFDEATASLDNQTERDLTRAIAALHGERTLIVIAHRLSTVQSCDRLIFMKDARIAGVGRYDELLRDPGFKRMATP